MKYTPEDFEGLRLTLRDYLQDKLPEPENFDLILSLIHAVKHQAREAANAKIEKWLAEAPVVYQYRHESDGEALTEWYEKGHLGVDTHKARLVCIEEIGK